MQKIGDSKLSFTAWYHKTVRQRLLKYANMFNPKLLRNNVIKRGTTKFCDERIYKRFRHTVRFRLKFYSIYSFCIQCMPIRPLRNGHIHIMYEYCRKILTYLITSKPLLLYLFCLKKVRGPEIWEKLYLIVAVRIFSQDGISVISFSLRRYLCLRPTEGGNRLLFIKEFKTSWCIFSKDFLLVKSACYFQKLTFTL